MPGKPPSGPRRQPTGAPAYFAIGLAVVFVQAVGCLVAISLFNEIPDKGALHGIECKTR